MQQLEIAGFQITPATRLRVGNVLRSLGKANLRNPEKLKYLLAPVIAKSDVEQKRFYDLFDVYWKELNEPAPTPIPAEETSDKSTSSKKNILPKWSWLIIAALTMGLILWAIIKIFMSQPEADTIISFKPIPNKITLGDSLLIKNLSTNFDSLNTQFYWELIDEESGNVEEIDSINHHGAFHINAVKNANNKQIRLIGHHRKKLTRDSSSIGSFTITCRDTVSIKNIVAPKEAKLGEEITFNVVMDSIHIGDQSLEYSWDFDDGNTEKGNTVKHSFDVVGSFQVQTRVIRIGANGACEAIQIHQISVGERAPLVAKKLVEDTADVVAFFNWGPWWLLGILAALSAFFWRRWWNRPTPEAEKADQTAFFQSTFDTSDKAPYQIPFEKKEGNISIPAGMFRMADTMRIRQEGLRKMLDVPATIKATAEKGGFPNLKLTTKTKPPEYLFLIDQETIHSHQSCLFQFVTQFLEKNDVYIEVFLYHSEFSRVWNHKHPNGIRLSQLASMYTHHRLIVFGDAYSLLESFSQSRPQLHKQAKTFFKPWANKTLVTPVPSVSWTFREGILYELFQVFPADLQGVQDAMNYLESEQALESKGIESFKKWRQEQQSLRKEPETNYRRWNRAKEYKAYLADHPKVYQWLCALAVYPEPNWNITLAIGKGLQSKGVEVNYDNLLLLSRIPWLKTGVLTASLRQQLLKELDIETEELARSAVKKELENIEEKIADSHIHFEFQSHLAIQKFALNPGRKEHREAIRYLNDQGLLTKSQTKELDLNLQKKEAKEGDLNTYLKKTDLPPEIPPRPFYTADFKIASGLTGLFLVIALLLGFLNGSDWLKEKASPASPKIDAINAVPTNNFLIKYAPIDSALVYNNMAVDEFYQLEQLQEATQLSGSAIVDHYEKVFEYLAKAVIVREDYQLAGNNLFSLYYNIGVEKYTRALASNKINKALLEESLEEFDLVAENSDSMKLDAYHAQGLVQWFLTNRDSALTIYQNMDSPFFDSLSLVPNLKTLLDITSDQTFEMSFQAIDNQTSEPLAGVRIEGNEINGLTGADGYFIFKFQQSDIGGTRDLTFTKGGYNMYRLSLRVMDDENFNYVVVRLDRRPGVIALPALLVEVIGKALSIEASEIQASSNIATDLGADDLDQLEIMMESEKAFSIFIVDSEWAKIETVGQLAQLIANKTTQSAINDKDGDGIADNDDYCPDVKGKASNKGCPPITTDKFKDTRDGKVYQTITIAGQTWTATNLNYDTPGSSCYSAATDCNQYGRLYTQEAAERACPTGWHLPSDEEWQFLLNFFDDKTKAYSALIRGGTSGADFMLGGWFDAIKGSSYYDRGVKGEYWTSTATSSEKGYRYSFNRQDKSIYKHEHEKALGYSCRCVKGVKEGTSSID